MWPSSVFIILIVMTTIFVSGMKVRSARHHTLQPHFYASPAQYAELLLAAAKNDKNDERVAHIRGLSAYWRHVSTLSSQMTLRDNATGTVLDCVPFDQQPALINAPRDVIQDATQRDAEHKHRRLNLENVESSFDGRKCPSGMVGIPRYRFIRCGQEGSASDDDSCWKVHLPPTKKRADTESKGPRAGGSYNDAGYHYVVSPRVFTSTNVNVSYVVLGVGSDIGVPTPTVPQDESHVLNQLWWLTTYGGSQQTVSLEVGWIDSSYWSTSKYVSLFVYSTPDAYNGSQWDQYNQAGGFVVYSGAPDLLGVGKTNFRYLLSYQILANGKGYELLLKPIITGTSYTFGKWIPLGYYPMYRYTSTPTFIYIQTGCEVYRATNADVAAASGRIYGWGTNQGVQGVDANYSPTQTSVYTATYGMQKWNESKWVSTHYVTFSGENV